MEQVEALEKLPEFARNHVAACMGSQLHKQMLTLEENEHKTEACKFKHVGN